MTRSMIMHDLRDPSEKLHKSQMKMALLQGLKRVQALAINNARDFVQNAAPKIKISKKLDTESERIQRLADEANKKAAKHIENIWEVTKDDIANTISETMADNPGYSISQLISKLANIENPEVAGMPDYRLARIARTETHSIYVEVNHDETAIEAEKLNLKATKTWRSAIFSTRTRPTHVAANGQTVGMDEMFEVGDALLRFPGDMEANEPGEIVNCRCVLTYNLE